MGLCRLNLDLALGLGGETSRLPLGGPHVAGLNDGAPRRLPGEDSRIVGGRACPEPGKRGLSRLGDRLETINELVGSELAHVVSLCAPRPGRGREKQMKPLPEERL